MNVENIKVIATGATGVIGTAAAPAVADIVTPENISGIVGLITQLVIGVTTLVALFKRNKTKNPNK